ncbi:MAG: acyltransferase [Deltaproteobacteria bacterium]|nr:acyltransferase [Deltaproteobacteria bacterium]
MQSHGLGVFSIDQFSHIGENVVFEKDVLVFHPENIEIGRHVYIGHQTILKGYYKNKMYIGDHTWIGQQCFLHSAGTLRIGNHVGMGPGVKIITSFHEARDASLPVIDTPLLFEPVIIEDHCDIGTGAIILPGTTIGKGCIIGAGAVITKDIPAYSVAVGNPARVIKVRHENPKMRASL